MSRFTPLRARCASFVVGISCLLPVTATRAVAQGYDPSCGCSAGCSDCGTGFSTSPYDGSFGDGATPSPGQPSDPGLDLSQQFGGGTNQFVTASTSGGAATNAGYIDTAVPFTHVRLRYDSAYDNPVPDRAEFFYGQCPCFFGPAGLGRLGPERSVDFQEVKPYLEWAYSDQISFFVEAPVRFIDPVTNTSHAGFGDMVAGFKWAYIAEPNWDYLTFQFKIYAPTGNENIGLGTGHVRLEPGVLVYRRLNDRAVFEAEIRDWISLSDNQFLGQDFSGNVLRYGVGLGYDLMQGCNACNQPKRLTAVTEFVGWTVLDGLGFDGGAFLDAGAPAGAAGAAPFVFDASGDTIVNVKLGARYTSGPSSLYLGYGRALTGDVWYDDIIRAEFRRQF